MNPDVRSAEYQGWPKLSVDLASPRAPMTCQACGTRADPPCWWEECDERDQSTGVLLILCRRCSDKIINPHPRLYRSLWWPRPWPGAMAICTACTYRTNLTCTHPKLRANGGPGLPIAVPKPQRTHLNYGGGRGEWVQLYPHEPRICEGLKV